MQVWSTSVINFFFTHTVTCYDNVNLNLNEKFHTTLIKDTANNNILFILVLFLFYFNEESLYTFKILNPSANEVSIYKRDF